jgi:tetratricopeptide (TPR) repeat protein
MAYRFMRILSIVLLMTVGQTGLAFGDQNDPRLGKLFTRLQAIETGRNSTALENVIWSIWLEGKDEKATLAMENAGRLLQQASFNEALAAFDEIIDLYPDFSEAWNKRATILFLLGRFEESLSDVETTITLEPRHFGALAGAAQMYVYQGRHKDALHAYEQALRVNPHLKGGQQMIETLREKLKSI